MRALGGAVLITGGAACAWLALPRAGATRTAALAAVALALFAVSHPLGDAIGAWPAVLACAGALAGAAAALARGRA